MKKESLAKRFGAISIKKGFITKEQFVEAMGIQIENELEGINPKLLGEILVSMGYMTAEQINEVVEALEKGE